MSQDIEGARRRLINRREVEGKPYSDVVQRGIMSGQWDNGGLVRAELKNANFPLQGDENIVE
jgi:hypothetical protein